jgi:hypothetical protein
VSSPSSGSGRPRAYAASFERLVVRVTSHRTGHQIRVNDRAVRARNSRTSEPPRSRLLAPQSSAQRSHGRFIGRGLPAQYQLNRLDAVPRLGRIG